jgi:hypothetical protein
MALSLSNSKFRAIALTVYLLVFAAAVFRLPFHFAVLPSVSVSYIFQYNNRVATLIFLAGAALFALLFQGLNLQTASRDSRVSRRSAVLAMASGLALSLIYQWISSPKGLQGENIYFYSRLSQLAAGKHIYRDFEFAYGPLWLYLPFWTGKLLHLDLVHGYIIFWLIAWTVGIWILYRIVNAIEIPSPYRTAIFFICVLDFGQALWPQGINYSPLRSLATGGLAMLVYAAYRRRYSMTVIVCAAVGSAVIATGVSPEHGIAFMLGTGLFFVLCAKPRPAGFWRLTCIMSLCFLTIIAISYRERVYATLLAFSSGAMNYPILPDAGQICVMSLYLVAACVAYMAFQRKQTDSLAVYLLCICLFGIPACFGRADAGHMQLGAFSALIIVGLSLGRYPRVSLLAAVVFTYCAATPQFRGEWTSIREDAESRLLNPNTQAQFLYRPTVAVFHLLHLDSHRQVIEAKIARLDEISTTAVAKIPHGTVVNAPLGLTRRGFTDDSGDVDYGYFFGLQDAISPPQVNLIIQWLHSHQNRDLILPRDWNKVLNSFPEADDPSFRTWLGMPWASPKRQMQVFLPLRDFIRANYAPDDTHSPCDFCLWHPIAPAPLK